MQAEPQQQTEQPKPAEPTEADLEHDAARLHREISGLDERIEKLNGERAHKRKELRATTSKLVTLKLKTTINT